MALLSELGVGRGRVASEMRRAAQRSGNPALSGVLNTAADGLTIIGDATYAGAVLTPFGGSAIGAALRAYGGYTSQTSEPHAQATTQAPPESALRVRRPVHGLTPMNPAPAFLAVFAPNGTPIQIKNGHYPGGVAPATSNFLLQDIDHRLTAAVQVKSALNGIALKHIGKTPDTLGFTGILIEAENMRWATEWLENYAATIGPRASLAAGTLVQLVTDGTVYSGTIMDGALQRSVGQGYQLFRLQVMMVLDSVTTLNPSVVDLTDTELSPVEQRYAQQLVEEGYAPDEARRQARLALASELVQGSIAGISYAGDLSLDNTQFNQITRYQNVNVGRMVAIAARANNLAGVELFNLRGVRENLIQDTRHLLQQSGQLDPVGGLLPLDPLDDQQQIYRNEIAALEEYNNAWANQGSGGPIGITYEDAAGPDEVQWRGR